MKNKAAQKGKNKPPQLQICNSAHVSDTQASTDILALHFPVPDDAEASASGATDASTAEAGDAAA